MAENAKEAYWFARLQTYTSSGLAARVWCAQNSVTESTFYYWRKRFSQVNTSSPAELIALTLPDRQIAQTGPMVELETPHGYVIRLFSESAIQSLPRVLAVLR